MSRVIAVASALFALASSKPPASGSVPANALFEESTLLPLFEESTGAYLTEEV